MKIETCINPKFSHLDEFTKPLPERFDFIGQEMKTGKTELRLVSVNGLLLTVKRFNRISLAHRILFSTICKSKARMAYEHSMLLAERDLTPKPVAYIDIYSKGLLQTSFYICLYTDRRPVEEMLSLPVAEADEGLKSFARFTCRLHKAGIYHDDYTLNNVLYKYNGFSYDFSLIDNDNLRIGRYSRRRGIRNLRRLSLPVDKMAIVAAEYARESGTNELITLNAMIFYRLHHIAKAAVRKWAKIRHET